MSSIYTKRNNDIKHNLCSMNDYGKKNSQNPFKIYRHIFFMFSTFRRSAFECRTGCLTYTDLSRLASFRLGEVRCRVPRRAIKPNTACL